MNSDRSVASNNNSVPSGKMSAHPSPRLAALSLVALSGCQFPFNTLPPAAPPSATSLICPFEGSEITFEVKGSRPTPELLAETTTVMRSRIGGLGIQGTSVSSANEDQILIQLPVYTDAERVETVLSSTGQLEFRPQRRGTEGELMQQLQTYRQLLIEQKQLQDTSNEPAKSENQQAIAQAEAVILALFDAPELTGADVSETFLQPMEGADLWEIRLVFNEEGTTTFAQLTREIAGTGRSLGIFVDGRMVSGPTVDAIYAETGITGGNAMISGHFNAQEAEALVAQLRGGTLPTPLEVVEHVTVRRNDECEIVP